MKIKDQVLVKALGVSALEPPGGTLILLKKKKKRKKGDNGSLKSAQVSLPP